MAEEQHLKELPSNANFYGKIESNGTTCTNEKKGTIKAYLSSLNRGRDPVENIEGAICYIAGMKEGQHSFYNEYCDFLYFWIGHKLSSIPAYSTSWRSQNFLRKSIEEIDEKRNCKISCGDINWDLFNERKRVFDYYYDYSTVRQKIMGDKKNCEGNWFGYLTKVSLACRTVEQNCAVKEHSTDDQYCSDYNSKYYVFCDALKHLIQECKPQPTEEEEMTCSHIEGPLQTEIAQKSKLLREADEAVRSATTTASLSSIFGTLGLTAFPLLLYKYTPLTSWFGNHTSGNGGARSNRRNRRSTGHHNFDASTESGSTYDSAIESTIGDSVAESATVQSAAYTRQPNRGERGANNTAGHRNNIGYGRI